MAGSALNALDILVRAEPEWSAAWRHRLALRAAAACMTLIGRSEDEAALRDAWLLRQPGDALGPAGNVLAAWRRLAGHSLPPDGAELQTVAASLSVGWSDGFGELIDVTGEAVRSGAPAPPASRNFCLVAGRLRAVLAHGMASCHADPRPPDARAAAAFGL